MITCIIDATILNESHGLLPIVEQLLSRERILCLKMNLQCPASVLKYFYMFAAFSTNE